MNCCPPSSRSQGKIQRHCWMLGYSSYICVPDSIAEGMQPTRWLSCYSACSQSSLPWLSLPHPPRNAVPTCCWKGKNTSCLLATLEESSFGGAGEGGGICLLLSTTWRTISIISEAHSIHCSLYFSFLLITLSARLIAINASIFRRPHVNSATSGIE